MSATTCPVCSSDVRRECIFCTVCGCRLLNCDACGTIRERDDRFCGACGAPAGPIAFADAPRKREPFPPGADFPSTYAACTGCGKYVVRPSETCSECRTLAETASIARPLATGEAPRPMMPLPPIGGTVVVHKPVRPKSRSEPYFPDLSTGAKVVYFNADGNHPRRGRR